MAEETLPFGPDTLVYKYNGKIFLLMGIDNQPVRFNVKCDPLLADQLREEYACVQPGYHMNKKHWNTVIVDGSAPAQKILDWIDQSYELIVNSFSRKKK